MVKVIGSFIIMFFLSILGLNCVNSVDTRSYPAMVKDSCARTARWVRVLRFASIPFRIVGHIVWLVVPELIIMLVVLHVGCSI